MATNDTQDRTIEIVPDSILCYAYALHHTVKTVLNLNDDALIATVAMSPGLPGQILVSLDGEGEHQQPFSEFMRALADLLDRCPDAQFDEVSLSAGPARPDTSDTGSIVSVQMKPRSVSELGALKAQLSFDASKAVWH